MNNIENVTVFITYEQLTKILIDYLRSNDEIFEDETVLSLDFPVPLNETGEIEFDIEVMYDE